MCCARNASTSSKTFATVCSDFGATLVEPNGEDDHVHLLVEYPPTVSISALVNSLKDVSSRRLRQRFEMRTHRDPTGRRPTSLPRPTADPFPPSGYYIEAQRQQA